MEKKGLYNKYHIEKIVETVLPRCRNCDPNFTRCLSRGSLQCPGKTIMLRPVDADAKYVVLRVDSGEYAQACRKAATTFANEVRGLNPQLSEDILELIYKCYVNDNRIMEDESK